MAREKIKGHYSYKRDDMHHDSNMKEVDNKMYGLSDGPMMRASTKQLQSTLTSQINATKVLMSLKAYNLFGNGSNMFVLEIKFMG